MKVHSHHTNHRRRAKDMDLLESTVHRVDGDAPSPVRDSNAATDSTWSGNEELLRLRYASCGEALMREAFRRRHPVKAFIHRHPAMFRSLFLLLLAAATVATIIASTHSPQTP